MKYSRTLDAITLEVAREGSNCNLEFEPAVSLRTDIIAAELNGRAVPFQVVTSDADQHVAIRVKLSGAANTIRIRLRNDFGVSYNSRLPALGNSSEGLRILSETWSPGRDQVTLEVSGLAGREYELAVWNGGQISAIDGAELGSGSRGAAAIHISMERKDPVTTERKTVVIHFAGKRSGRTAGKKE